MRNTYNYWVHNLIIFNLEQYCTVQYMQHVCSSAERSVQLISVAFEHGVFCESTGASLSRSVSQNQMNIREQMHGGHLKNLCGSQSYTKGHTVFHGTCHAQAQLKSTVLLQ